MSGETDLAALLRGMRPVLDPRRFNFSTYPKMTLEEAAGHSPIAVFQEPEGMTLITEANAQPSYAMITLMIHSSLEAIGLTAVISRALAAEGISANVVAAFYHDHIFVSDADADRAVTVLEKLSTEAA